MRTPKSYIREEFVRGAATSKGPQVRPVYAVSLILRSVTHPDVYGVWQKGARHRRLSGGGLFPSASSAFSDSHWGRVQQLACEASRILEPERHQGYLRRKSAPTD